MVRQTPGIVSTGNACTVNAEEDQFVNLEFAVIVECDVCGHMSFFNSENFFNGSEKILTNKDVCDEGP